MGTESRDHNQAAAWFAGLATLAMGGAGLLIAGMVLGFDYLMHGEPDERDHLAQRRAQNRRSRYEDALAWIEADRADRERARRARRDWFEADPTNRGSAPSGSETLGRALARGWNNLIVGGHRFREGWKKGRAEARERRDDGTEQWWRRPKPDRRPKPPPVEPSRVVDEPTPAPAATPEQETPRPQPTPDVDDVIDAEIIPDVPEPGYEVVPVGADEPTAGSDVNRYADRLADLRAEVDQTRGGRQENPSPPLSTLN